jgi:uncharacterized protein YdhG (YjbR/CyaY superfamily)
MTSARKTSRIKTVDDYIAFAPKERRAALMKLRATIRAATRRRPRA